MRWHHLKNLALLSGALAFLPVPARAHPHVWVNVETTVHYDKGTVTALHHKWFFDDMYTAMAVQGLNANGDGTYSRLRCIQFITHCYLSPFQNPIPPSSPLNLHPPPAANDR